MQAVVLYRFFCELGVRLTQQLVVHSDAVIGQGFTVAVVDTLAHVQKLLIKLHGFPLLFDIIVEHANGVIGATLVSDLPGPPAPKGKHFVILEPAQNSYICCIIDFVVLPALLLICGAVD